MECCFCFKMVRYQRTLQYFYNLIIINKSINVLSKSTIRLLIAELSSQLSMQVSNMTKAAYGKGIFVLASDNWSLNKSTSLS